MLHVAKILWDRGRDGNGWVLPSQTQTHEKYLNPLKTHTCDGFRILPKPKPIGLAGTHGLPVGLHFTIQFFLKINKFNKVNIICSVL